jgi:uncharacterized protein (TIGR02679 family)
VVEASFPYCLDVVVALSDLPAELAPLWRALHDRLSSGRTVSSVRIGPLSLDERTALADLLGMKRLPGERPTVPVRAVEGALGMSVRDIVTQQLGPLADRAADRQRATAERAELWGWLADSQVVRAQPALLDWVASVRRGGLVGGSVPQTRAELGRVLRVLQELPAAGVPLPVFADAVLSDPHALDEDTRCAVLVARALCAIFDVAVPTDAPARRALWSRAGIADDELSSTVLVGGLRAAGGSAVAQVLRLCAADSQAAVLTLRQLRGVTVLEDVPATVWVVENPSVLALALDRFGADCPPLVCTSGWPSSAGVRLLELLRSAGADLLYHGDFDGEGLRIAANVVARTGARPWRMGTADYLSAAGDGPPVGKVSPAPWDPDLAGHLMRHGRAVPEERVAAALLDEVARTGSG